MREISEGKLLLNHTLLLYKSVSSKYGFQFISIIKDLVEIDARPSYKYVIVGGLIGTHLIKEESVELRPLFNYRYR